LARIVENTRYFSSVETSMSASSPRPAVTCCGAPPEAKTFQTLSVPPRLEEKYTKRSSADQAGDCVSEPSRVSWRTLPLAISTSASSL